MSVEAWIKVWRAGFCISFVGALQLIVSLIVAMTMYSGGNFENRNAALYRPSVNFLSDLGRTISISGESNLASCRVFSTSLSLFALSLIPYFLFMPLHAWDKAVPLRVAACLGGLAILCLLIVAAHPADLYPASHHLALFAFVFLIFLCSSTHAYAMLTSRENTALVMPLLSVGVAMLTIGYSISASKTAAAYMFHRNTVPLGAVVFEKFVFIGLMLWFVAYSIRSLLYTDFSEYERSQRDVDAEAYLPQVGYRHSQD